MQVEEVLDKQEWNQLILSNSPQSGAFLQCFEWGKFQRRVGHEPFRLLLSDQGTVLAAGQWLVRPLRAGKRYAYCPRGPLVLDTDIKTAVHNFMQNSVFAGNIFARFEPLGKDESLTIFGRQIDDVQPAHTLITDLSPETEDIMMDMHSKTRYNVRLAGRKGVEVDIDPNIDFSEVWPLFQETAERGGFTQHSKKHFTYMLNELDSDDCNAFLATAVFEGNILAVNIMVDCNGVRTYLHGASSRENRNVMAPYRLHWELMKDAKTHGITTYDWWGVAPKDADDSHPLHGVTRFKEKFGGDRVAYPGTFDYPIRGLWYKLYDAVRTLRS